MIRVPDGRSCVLGTILTVAVISAIACGFVFQGTTQVVRVTTDPSEADASFAGRSTRTPGSVTVRRQEWAVLRATKDGYEPTCRLVGARRDPWFAVLDSIPVGLGWIIDRPTEALRRFPPEVALDLPALPEGAFPAELPSDS